MRTSQICPTCTTYVNSICVVYNGTYLSNINASPLDTLDKILANINTATGVINSSIASINTSIIATNNSITTLSGIVALKENSSNKSSGAIGTSVTLFPTQSAVKTYVDDQVTIVNGNLALKENIADKVTTQADFISNGSSVIKYPAIKAVKDYVDGVTVGLLQDNGQYDPTITGEYPTSSDTLSGGPVQVGDIWYISANGTVNGNSVLVGYSVRALINGADPVTDADWAIANVGLGFVPENSINKSDDGTFNSGSPSSVLFPTQNAVASYVALNPPTLDQVLIAGAISTTPLVIGDALITPLEYSSIGAGYIDIYSTNTNSYAQYRPEGIVIDEISGGDQMIINFNNNNQTIDFPAESGTLALEKYKVYTAIASWGVSGLTTIVLENTLGATITWNNVLSTMTGTASSAVFTNNKTVFIVGSYFAGTNSYNNICKRIDSSTLNLFSIKTSDGTSGAAFGQTFILEIRVYP